MPRPLAAAIVAVFVAVPAVADAPYRAVQEVLDTRETVVGEPLRWPEGTARVHTVVITLGPGESTPWHRHGVPLHAYLLQGEVTVDYGQHGKRTYKAGDAFMEAMGVAHAGTNTGRGPTRILATFLGAVGRTETEKVESPN